MAGRAAVGFFPRLTALCRQATRMSLVVRTVCRHLLEPDGTFATKTMIVTTSMTPADFCAKLEVKVQDTLPAGGVLSYASDVGEPEKELSADERIYDTIKGAGLTKCVVFFTPPGFTVLPLRLSGPRSTLSHHPPLCSGCASPCRFIARFATVAAQLRDSRRCRCCSSCERACWRGGQVPRVQRQQQTRLSILPQVR